MVDYKLESSGGVLYVPDQIHIPNHDGNRHWVQYQKWLAAGNTPDPAPPPPKPPTDEERVDSEATSDPMLRALVAVMAEDAGVTVEQFLSRLKGKLLA